MAKVRQLVMAAALALTAGAGVAVAQAGDWKAARAAGEVGEQPDGYLGIVGAPTPALRALVNDVNIQRKAVYTQQSAASGATIEAFALAAGCNLIKNTPADSKYMAPDGRWLTRGADAPVRDARCV